MNSEALFAKTPPLKLFFIAALPGAVSMLASALYQTFDGVFVGHFLGSTAFAAVNLAMPFVIINFPLPLPQSTWPCLLSSSISLWRT